MVRKSFKKKAHIGKPPIDFWSNIVPKWLIREDKYPSLGDMRLGPSTDSNIMLPEAYPEEGSTQWPKPFTFGENIQYSEECPVYLLAEPENFISRVRKTSNDLVYICDARSSIRSTTACSRCTQSSNNIGHLPNNLPNKESEMYHLAEWPEEHLKPKDHKLLEDMVDMTNPNGGMYNWLLNHDQRFDMTNEEFTREVLANALIFWYWDILATTHFVIETNMNFEELNDYAKANYRDPPGIYIGELTRSQIEIWWSTAVECLPVNKLSPFDLVVAQLFSRAASGHLKPRNNEYQVEECSKDGNDEYQVEECSKDGNNEYQVEECSEDVEDARKKLKKDILYHLAIREKLSSPMEADKGDEHNLRDRGDEEFGNKFNQDKFVNLCENILSQPVGGFEFDDEVLDDTKTAWQMIYADVIFPRNLRADRFEGPTWDDAPFTPAYVDKFLRLLIKLKKGKDIISNHTERNMAVRSLRNMRVRHKRLWAMVHVAIQRQALHPKNIFTITSLVKARLATLDVTPSELDTVPLFPFRVTLFNEANLGANHEEDVEMEKISDWNRDEKYQQKGPTLHGWNCPICPATHRK